MSIVEIVVALAILGVIAVGMMGFFTDSFKFQSRSQKTVAAQKIAEYVIEQLRSSGCFEVDKNEVFKLKEDGEYTYTTDNYTYEIIVKDKEELGVGMYLYDVTVTVKAEDGIEATVNNKLRMLESEDEE